MVDLVLPQSVQNFRENRDVFGAPKSWRDGKNALYATADTRRELNWLGRRVTEIAEADVLVLRPDDLQKGTGKELRDLVRSILPKDTFRELDENFRAKDKNGVSGWDYYATENKKGKGAFAIKFDFDDDGKNDFGIIITDDAQKTPEQFFSEYIGIKSNLIQNVPGTAFDYFARTLYHEAAHITQPKENSTYHLNPLPYEIDADQKSIIAYMQDVRAGFPLNPDVVNAIYSARLGSSLSNYGDALSEVSCRMVKDSNIHCGIPSHATHIGLTVDNTTPDGLPSFKTPSVDELRAMMSVKAAINGMHGNLFIIDSFEKMKGAGKDLPPDAKEYFKSSLDMMDSMTNPVRAAEVGSVLTATDPIAAKAVLDRMVEFGMFDTSNDPHVHKYIRELGAFFDRHVPNHQNEPSYRRMHGQFGNPMVKAALIGTVDRQTDALVEEAAVDEPSERLVLDDPADKPKNPSGPKPSAP